MRANIEELKESIIDSNVSFEHGFEDLIALLEFRKANIETTQMIWITKRVVIDPGFTVYNPKALIFLILN